MKKIILLLCMAIAITGIQAQRSAAEDNEFVFTTKKDDGNSKFIKYTAFSAGYSMMNQEVDEYDRFTAIQNQAYHLNWEAYNTYSRKIAGSTQLGLSYFSNQDFLVSVDYSLYFVLFKGFYIRLKGGYGTLASSGTDATPYVFTYGGEAGYLFKLKSAEGKRPVFLSLFGGYNGYGGTALDYNTSYINSYTSNGPGGGLKIMFGPKPSAGY